MEPVLSINDQEAVKDFRLRAKQFCEFIEGCEHLDQPKLIRGLSVHLAGICEAATRLPCVNPATVDGNDLTAESAEEHSRRCVALATRLRKQLGSLDGYWNVFEPTQKQEAIQCSLSMDLADIFMDLREGLRLQAGGAAPEDVYWQWRFDFLSHWSRHAASALKVVFILLSRV
ncbi:MAG: DUF5063 domain-containing protein [Candidatus Acidiferrum sp.]